MQAAMYGPLVLAARMGNDGLTHEMQYDTTGRDIHPAGGPKAAPPELTASDVASTVAPAGSALTFSTTTGDRRELIPLYRISGERYAVYFKTRRG